MESNGFWSFAILCPREQHRLLCWCWGGQEGRKSLRDCNNRQTFIWAVVYYSPTVAKTTIQTAWIKWQISYWQFWKVLTELWPLRELWGESAPRFFGLLRAVSIPWPGAASLQPLLPPLWVSPRQLFPGHLSWDLGPRTYPRYSRWPRPKILHLHFIGIILSPNKVAFLESGIRNSVSFDSTLSPLQCSSFG